MFQKKFVIITQVSRKTFKPFLSLDLSRGAITHSPIWYKELRDIRHRIRKGIYLLGSTVFPSSYLVHYDT